ncbi:MAG: hypothetical protein ACOZDY_11295 [Pseudomonadota bacterium]
MHPHTDARRAWRGPVRAAIFDRTGTPVDFGSGAPEPAFADAFGAFGIRSSGDPHV